MAALLAAQRVRVIGLRGGRHEGSRKSVCETAPIIIIIIICGGTEIKLRKTWRKAYKTSQWLPLVVLALITPWSWRKVGNWTVLQTHSGILQQRMRRPAPRSDVLSRSASLCWRKMFLCFDSDSEVSVWGTCWRRRV